MFNKSKTKAFTEAKYQELLVGMSDKACRDIVRLCLRPNCSAAPRWFRELESIFLKTFNWKVDSKNREWRSLFLPVASVYTKDEFKFSDDLLTAYKIEVEDEFMYGKEYVETNISYLRGKFRVLLNILSALDPSQITLEVLDSYLVDWYKDLDSSELSVGYKSTK